jgi:outer membrane protein OmpA-like peptidoglycan-associated protein
MMSIRVVVSACLAPLLVASVAAANPVAPAERSQNPRNGLIADVAFGLNSAALGWSAQRKLARVATWAAANPDGTIVIEGHASPDGDAAYNVELSLLRANTVRRELVDAGIAGDRLIVAGFGSDSKVQRGSNRRVAIWVTREDPEAALALVHARGAKVVRTGEDGAEQVSRR